MSRDREFVAVLDAIISSPHGSAESMRAMMALAALRDAQRDAQSPGVHVRFDVRSTPEEQTEAVEGVLARI